MLNNHLEFRTHTHYVNWLFCSQNQFKSCFLNISDIQIRLIFDMVIGEFDDFRIYNINF